MQTRKTIVKLTFLLIGILLYLPSYSQENFQPGSITLANGEKLEGFIDYRQWGSNPDQIVFKTSLEQKANSYSHDDLSNFSVQDEFYVSAEFDIETSPTATNNLDTYKKFNIEKRKGFLKTILMGTKSLLVFKENAGKKNFYIKRGTSYELLLYKKYILNEGSSEMRRVDHNKYLEQLAEYFQSCPNVYNTLKNTAYKLKSLEKVFAVYYECTDEEISYNKKQGKIETQIGAFAGVINAYISYIGDRAHYRVLIDTDFPSTLNYSGGIFLNLVFPSYLGKWSIYNELQYNFLDYSGYYELQGWGGLFQNTDMEILLSILKINNQLRFRYPINEKMSFFANSGVSNGLILETSNYKREQTNLNSHSEDEIIEGKAIATDLIIHEKSILAGIGCSLNNFSLEFRYERASDLVKSHSVRSSRNHFYMLLGYRFK